MFVHFILLCLTGEKQKTSGLAGGLADIFLLAMVQIALVLFTSLERSTYSSTSEAMVSSVSSLKSR